MFVFTSAWSTIKRHKCRTLLIMVVSAAAIFSGVFNQALSAENNEAVHGTGYQLLQPTAVIRPNASKLARRNGANSDITKDYLPYAQYAAYASDLQQMQIQPQFVFTEYLPARQTGSVKAIPGTEDQSSDKTGGEFTVVGLYDPNGVNINHAGKFKVVQGRSLDFKKPGKQDALVSQALAQKNGLTVGSTFKVGNATSADTSYELKVKGIYAYTSEPLEGKAGRTKLAKENRDNAIYVSPAFPQLADENVVNGKSTGWQTPEFDIGFTLQSVSEYETFKKTINQVGIPKGFKITSPTIDEYMTSIQPLKTLASRLRNGTNLTYIVTGVLLALLALWNFTHRRDEIAMDMIVGRTKANIGTQLMLEFMLPALTGLAVGGIAILLAIKPMGKALTKGHAIPLVSDCWIPMWYVLGAIAVLSFMAYIRLACARRNALFDTRIPPEDRKSQPTNERHNDDRAMDDESSEDGKRNPKTKHVGESQNDGVEQEAGR